MQSLHPDRREPQPAVARAFPPGEGLEVQGHPEGHRGGKAGFARGQEHQDRRAGKLGPGTSLEEEGKDRACCRMQGQARGQGRHDPIDQEDHLGSWDWEGIVVLGVLEGAPGEVRSGCHLVRHGDEPLFELAHSHIEFESINR